MGTQNLSYCNNYTDLANSNAQSNKYTTVTLKEVRQDKDEHQYYHKHTNLSHSKVGYLSLLQKLNAGIQNQNQHTIFLQSFRLGSNYLRNIYGYYVLQK